MNNDLISREALKEELNSRPFPQDYSTTLLLGTFNELIDNAPPVEPRTEYGTDGQPYKLSMTNGKEYARPQGECKTCKHRDPEDKKCDCGGQERQGCPFPVSDDYFCKFYEKGGAE